MTFLRITLCHNDWHTDTGLSRCIFGDAPERGHFKDHIVSQWLTHWYGTVTLHLLRCLCKSSMHLESLKTLKTDLRLSPSEIKGPNLNYLISRAYVTNFCKVQQSILGGDGMSTSPPMARWRHCHNFVPIFTPSVSDCNFNIPASL